MVSDDMLHIAVGVVSDADGRILISERKPDCAYAGQWEFPGGKCESGESVQSALARELHEELGIQVESSRPLIRFSYRYPDRHVLLDTWMVTDWQGQAADREGQRFAWVAPTELSAYPMLVANQPIIQAVRLPTQYLITPEPGADLDAFIKVLDRRLAAGTKMARLRAYSLSPDVYAGLARRCLERCRRSGAQLLLDRDPGMVEALGADGLHFRSADLIGLSERPVSTGKWLAASCHNRAELQRAVGLGVDFAVLGPVKATPSHPDVDSLGWDAFKQIIDDCPLPVYGIGGLGLTDLEAAWHSRAQGIAAMRGLWKA